MNTPLISIIIPLYNTEKYIEKAIESVINQTYKNWELIIIDDCSTDSSLDIVLDIRKRNGFSNKKMVIKRIKKNMGTYVALNIGLKLAKGNYFCVLGSDAILGWGIFIVVLLFLALVTGALITFAKALVELSPYILFAADAISSPGVNLSV